MDLVSISRALGALAIATAAAAAVAGAVAFANGETSLVSGFSMTCLLGAFVGASLRIMTTGRPSRGGVREALLFALLAWTLVPALAAPPFLFAGAGSWLHAYADAVSAATTTGLPAFFAREEAAASVVLWWNVLQWAGGAASVLTALVVLASLNLSGAGLHKSPLFTLEPDHVFDRFAPMGRAVLTVYAIGTAAAFVILLLSGAEPADAAAIAAAGLATGGLMLPGGATDLSAAPTIVVAAASVALVFGAFNFALHFDALRTRNLRVYTRDTEAQALIAFFLVAAAFMLVAAGGGVRAALGGVAVATTGGWDVGGVREGAVVAVGVMALTIIGGSPASTAGGVKLMRIVLLSRQTSGELGRLSSPSAVYELRFRGQTLPARAVLSMLAYVLAYAAGLGALIVAFAASGAPFEAATAAAAAAIANAGPAFALAAGEEALVLLEGPGALTTFCVGMILGRLEVFAAVAAFVPGLWRN